MHQVQKVVGSCGKEGRKFWLKKTRANNFVLAELVVSWPCGLESVLSVPRGLEQVSKRVAFEEAFEEVTSALVGRRPVHRLKLRLKFVWTAS